MQKKYYYGTGRRKSAVARVFLKTDGVGQIQINKKDIHRYFERDTSKMVLLQPLETLDLKQNVDLYITVKGGGLSAQAGAIRFGLARALVELSESYRPPLKSAGFLTRDSRCVERKKPGLRKARKRPQYSKR